MKEPFHDIPYRCAPEDEAYIGKCHLITGIHGDDPKKVYADLCEGIDDVIANFETEGRALPPPKIRPMHDVGQ